ncbi:MAG: protein kinase [Candidatus Berkiella sp.]
MLSTGVTSQIQLDTLGSSLSYLRNYYSNKKNPIPPSLNDYGLHHSGDLGLLYEEIIAQIYKFHDALPGEMIKLTSMVAANFGISVYATRDNKGNFQVILDKNAVRIRIDTLSHDPWQPITALNDRIQHFTTNLPAHLQPYLQDHTQNYVQVLQNRLQDIDALYLGHTLTIDANTIPSQKHPLRIIKTASSEFQVLLETFNPDEPFVRVDSSQKTVWRNYEGILLDERAILFLNDIQNALDQFRVKGLPAQLVGLIQPSTLENIYEYIIKNPHLLLKLNSGQSFRLPKELTKLDRTLNIVREPTGELMLMLETKRKLASGLKDNKRTIGQGTFGTVKPSWRIDTLVPEEWVNKVMKNRYAREADYEALFSQSLVESRNDANHNVLNVSLLGELFTSNSVVKRSQYSKRAVGDLLSVLYNPTIVLTPNDKKRITQNILDGVAVMHAQGKAHQDLKLPNIFIYRDEEGYYAKVADFGISYNPALPLHKTSLASGGYESPEIMAAYESANSNYHNYYYQDPFIQNHSYAYKVHMGTPNRSPESPEAIEFRKPHTANDMWALGIIFFELEFKMMPRFGFSVDEQRINSHPLIKGLLNPNRNQRLTVSQAIEKHREVTGAAPLKPESREPAVTFAKQTSIKAEPKMAQAPYAPVINYSAVVDVQFLDLGNIQGPLGRMKRDIYIHTLKKAYDNDPKLFKLILESQTTQDLERLNQSLVRYLQPPEKKIYIFPELISAVDAKLSEKKDALSKGGSDEVLAEKGKAEVAQYLTDIQPAAKLKF